MGRFQKWILLFPLLVVSSIGCSGIIRSINDSTISNESSSQSFEDVANSAWSYSRVEIPNSLKSNSQQSDKFRILKNKLCYLALENGSGKKMFCINDQGEAKKAFDFRPGADDGIQRVVVDHDKMLVVSSFANVAKLGVYNGTSFSMVPEPKDFEVMGYQNVIPTALGAYFSVYGMSSFGIYYFDGIKTNRIRYDLMPAPLNQGWNLWGASGNTLYFEAYENSSHVVYSYDPEQNDSQPVELGRFKSIWGNPLIFADDGNNIPTKNSLYFSASDSNDVISVYYLDVAQNKITKVGGEHVGGIGSLYETSMKGACFTASLAASPGTGNGYLFCIDSASNTSKRILPQLGNAFPRLFEIDSTLLGVGSGNNGGEFGFFDGTNYTVSAVLTNLYKAGNFNYVASIGQQLYFYSRDGSAQGKTYCPNGSDRLFKYDVQTSSVTALTDPIPCMSTTYTEYALSNFAKLGTDLYFTQVSMPGRRNYEYSRTVYQEIRKWNGSSLSTVGAGTFGDYIQNYGGFTFSPQGIYSLISSSEGKKVYRYDSSGWSKLFELNSGSSDEIDGICKIQDEILFSDMVQPNSGSTSSHLRAYNETTGVLRLVQTSTATWGPGYSLGCSKYGNKVSYIYQDLSDWKPGYYEYGGTVSSATVSGDAVTSSSNPMSDPSNTGTLSEGEKGKYFLWPDVNGLNKLFLMKDDFSTTQVTDLIPGLSDEISSVVESGDQYLIANSKRDGNAAVYLVESGNVISTNLSSTSAWLKVFKSGASIYAYAQEFDSIQEYENGIFKNFRLYSWNGIDFEELVVPNILRYGKSVELIGTKDEVVFFKMIPHGGEKFELYAFENGEFGKVTTEGGSVDVASVSSYWYGLYQNMPYLVSTFGAGAILLKLNRN